MRTIHSTKPMLALCFASLLSVSWGVSAKGVLTKTEPPPMPAVDANQCVIDGPMAGYPSEFNRIKNKSEKQAVSRWQKAVKEKYGPQFAKWKHASKTQGKDVFCESLDQPVGRVVKCYAKATPCMKK